MSLKKSLEHQLKRFPLLYRLAEKVYFALAPAHLMELAIGTRAREREWARRHLRKGNDWGSTQHIGQDDEWVMSYWDSRNHRHRPFLIEKIAAFYPFSSVLEIGCNCGPNLYRLARKFPDTEIVGIDINPDAVRKGNELLAAEGISNVRLLVAKADELGQFQDKSFDVVFTDAVLIYIGPDKIRKVVRDMLRLARKGLVLLERHPFEHNFKDPHGLGVSYKDLWVRDYTSLLKDLVPEPQISITRVTGDIWKEEGWQETGAIIEVGLPEKPLPVQKITERVISRTKIDVLIVCHTEFEDRADKAKMPQVDEPPVRRAVLNIINIADKYGARVTFAVCPEVAPYLPKDIKHEIGLHIHPGKPEWGLIDNHLWYSGDLYLKEHCQQSVDSSTLRDYPYEEQLGMIRTGTEYLEREFGTKLKTFVAGRWSLNNDTIRALVASGITHDCSATARFKHSHYDWLKLPRICLPYHLSQEDYQEKGDLPLLVIPISQTLFAGNVSTDSARLVGLPWLKACFLEYYRQGIPLFHICLHSHYMTDPYFVSALDDFLKFITQHKGIDFKFASEIKEYDPIAPKTDILPYLLGGVNWNIVSSFIRLKVLKRK